MYPIEQFSRLWYGKCLFFVFILINFAVAAFNLVFVFVIHSRINVFGLVDRNDSFFCPTKDGVIVANGWTYTGFILAALSHFITSFTIFYFETSLMLLSVILNLVALVFCAATSLWATVVGLIISLALTILILAWFAHSLSENDPKDDDSLSLSTYGL